MSHYSKQVLILNITRMGDLAQTVPLLRRLQEESPGVAIDLVIDTRLAPMAALLHHWHLVLWAYQDGDLSRFMSWLALTHTQRWHAYRQTVGTGHLYQGRFKSFVVQTDDHLVTVCRYVERNALRAGSVERAEAWRWNSLWRVTSGEAQPQKWIHNWPITRLREWVAWVNGEEGAEDLTRIRQSVVRSQPFGQMEWVTAMIERLGLSSTIRNEGRPRKVLAGNGS